MCVCSHLPAYLVAAFAKRLARLALTAPPTALLILLPFIYNLIRRHPSCRVLLHKPSADDGECRSQAAASDQPLDSLMCVYVCVRVRGQRLWTTCT